MIAVGSQIEKYIVEAELGGGGMAKVYKVRHALLGSTHALKVLNPELVQDEELRQRFLSEGQIQARLRHPNIVAVTDIVAVPGVAGLVMDFIEGPTLEDFVNGLSEPPAPTLVRDVFRQVLAGVGYAHQNGIIHRDIKPANVLLEFQGPGRFHARILDFGIAKVMQGDAPTGKRATRAGARMGTPHYMSPEQIQGAKNVTAKSDIFSLGATLYEFATGKMAFNGESDYEIEHKIVNGAFEPPEKLHPGIDPVLKGAIVKSLAPNPEERYPTCEEFSRALDAPAKSGEQEKAKKSGGVAITVGLLALGGVAIGAYFVLNPAPGPAPVEAEVKTDAPPPPPPPPPPPQEPEKPALLDPPAGMLKIEGGTLTMGREPYGLAGATDIPPHEVHVGPFALQQSEVTFGEYKAFVDAGKAKPQWDVAAYNGLPDAAKRHLETLPATKVSWEDADAFCRWAYLHGRLPTEAEWEWAARGPAGNLYPWGNDWDPAKAQAGQGENGGTAPSDRHLSGQTPLGLRDMAGNVWEWTASTPEAYPGSKQLELPRDQAMHVIRGGSFYNSDPNELTTTVRRFGADPNKYTGFRCAADIVP